MNGSALETFVAGILWMSALCCLLIVRARPELRFNRLVWLVATAGFFAMAIDEVFMLHEALADAAEYSTNDHLQVAQLGGAGVALLFLDRLERLPAAVRLSLLVGFVLHVAYLVTEVGDGDYFRMSGIDDYEPIWVLGEYLEFLALVGYFLGVSFFQSALTRDAEPAA